MTAETIARTQHGRRSGAGWICRCPAHDDRSPSLSIRDADGRVLVHCHAGCDQAAVIDALRARGLWPERERQNWTPADRKRWAAQRRAIERDLPVARLWRRAIVLLIEDDLDEEKNKLLTQDEEAADTVLIGGYTRILARLKRAEDESLVREYREWRAEMPGECAGLVRWAQERERAEIRALARYLVTLGVAE